MNGKAQGTGWGKSRLTVYIEKPVYTSGRVGGSVLIERKSGTCAYVPGELPHPREPPGSRVGSLSSLELPEKNISNCLFCS